MPRTLYIRLDPAEHAAVVEAAHAARTSLQDFCLTAILNATARWRPGVPIVAEAALDLGEAGEFC
jgi:hypothetical protein